MKKMTSMNKRPLSRSFCDIETTGRNVVGDDENLFKHEIMKMSRMGNREDALHVIKQYIIFKRRKVQQTHMIKNALRTKSMPSINNQKVKFFERKQNGFLDFISIDENNENLVKLILDEINMELEMEGICINLGFPSPPASPILSPTQTIKNCDFQNSSSTLHTLV